jgi:threonine/homoserine/homoserine lactone efflux protein
MIPEIVMVIALTRGASEIMKSAVASNIIWLVGGFILLAMGINITWKNRHAVLITTGNGTSLKTGRLIITAILTSISSPYWFIWWATAGTAYVIWAAQMGTSGIVFFFIGHIMADLIWYTIVSFAVSRGRKIMNDKVYRGLMIGSGSIVIVLGIYFAISGTRFFVS